MKIETLNNVFIKAAKKVVVRDINNILAKHLSDCDSYSNTISDLYESVFFQKIEKYIKDYSLESSSKPSTVRNVFTENGQFKYRLAFSIKQDLIEKVELVINH